MNVITDMLIERPVLLDAKEDGKTRARFKATQSNVVNSNSRLYPLNVMSDGVERSNGLVKENRMIGESPHPKHFVGKQGQVVFDTQIDNSVIKIFNQFIDKDGTVYVDAEVLDTAKGKDLKALIDASVPVGISMRALGDSVRKSVNGVMVDVATKLDIQSYDVVMNPATPGCEVVQVLTDSQIAEVLADGVQITVPSCPSCGSALTPQDPDGDGDLDFYSCDSCKDVYIPEENFQTQTVASQNLRKLPNDPNYDGYSLARQYKMGMMQDSQMTDGKLSADDRKNLKSSDFAVPGKRTLPINDKDHVEMAWKMVDKTKGLTDEEKKDAKNKIKSKAKSFGIDTSAWKDSTQKEEDDVTVEEMLKAMQDSTEFQKIIEAKAKAIAQPALDAAQAQADAKAQAEALEKAKNETKTFTDSKIAELKDKLPAEVLTLMTDSVKEATDKEIAGALIDSMVNVYSQTSAKANLAAVGFDGNTQQPTGAVRVQVNEQKPWSKQVNEMLDSFDRIAQEQGFMYDPSIRKVNKKFVDEIIGTFEKQVGNEAMKDSVAFMDSVMSDATSVSVTTAQLLNQPTIQQAIIIQAFQDVESLQFMASETFEGSEVRWPVETFTSAAQMNPATGVMDMLVGEGAGIPESAINLSWLTFNPAWRRNAISLTTDVIKTLLSGPAKYDPVTRGLYHIAFDKRRKLDNLAYLEMAMAADEYQPNVIANDAPTAVGTNPNQLQAVSNGTNVAYKYFLQAGAAATAGSNPIVRPRTKKQILPTGSTQSVTSNPFTVSVGGTAKTMGYLDANGNLQAGDYAVDFENGIVYFAASAGLSSSVFPTCAYSAVTNYDRWATAIPTGMDADKYYNTLLQLVTKEVALMGSSPRFNRPNLGIMSLNAGTFIENAAMWYKLNSPDLGALSGLADSTFFGSRSGVNFARINAPTVFGDGRIILTQKGATRYAIETPYAIQGPYPKYDQNNQIIDAQLFYGRENSVLATPQTIDTNGNILNPKSRSIKLI